MAREHPSVPCVGAIITDQAGRLLLIQRRNEPGAGLWSLPGGRIEPGETDQQAVVREVREETGLIVTCGPLVGAVERPGLAGAVLDIRDYHAGVSGGELEAADDAAATRWAGSRELAALDAAGALTDGLLAALSSWGVPAAGAAAGGPGGSGGHGRGGHGRGGHRLGTELPGPGQPGGPAAGRRDQG